MKGKLTDGVFALISAASNLYPLVTQRTQGLFWNEEWRIKNEMKKWMRDEWGMKKMDNDDGEMVNI